MELNLSWRPIALLNLLMLSLVLSPVTTVAASLPQISQSTPDHESVIEGMPLELLLFREVNLSSQLSRSIEEERGIGEIKEIEKQREALRSELLPYLSTAQGYREFVRFLENAGPVERQEMRGLAHLVQTKINASRLENDGLGPADDSELKAYLGEQRSRDSYQYAYGKEVSRETIDEFEAIHRNTFFENKSHSINIGIDFLEPIKKVLKALKLEKKFSWVFENSLFFGYKSSFKHHKKVFMRFKGYYGKIAVKVELMRRKRYWWGYGSWEKVGVTTKMLEEPIAVVGTEVKELN